MVTEIEKAPVGDQTLQQDGQSANGLRTPSLEAQEEYQKKGKPAAGSGLKSESGDNSATGFLEITPLFAPSKGTEKGKQNTPKSPEEQRIDEGKTPAQNPEAKKVDDKAGTPQSPEEQKAADNSTPKPEAQKPDDKRETPAKGELPKVINAKDIPTDPESQKANYEVSDSDDSTNDGKDVPLNPEAQIEKNQFFQKLGDKLRTDGRYTPEQAQQITAYLRNQADQMDRRALDTHEIGIDGNEINQQAQLTKAYRSLTQIADHAEDLKLDGSDERVFNNQMVNNILADALQRGADPLNNENQGQNNTCAVESINREYDATLVGDSFESVADICTTGKFNAVDNEGRDFICQVDKASLRPDAEASHMLFGRNNARGAYGQITDIRTAQLNLDIRNRSEGKREGLHSYREMAPTSQRDTGERVVNTETNTVVGNSPTIGGELVGDAKQALFGHKIAPDYAKRTTLVGAERAFSSNPRNATVISNPDQILPLLNANATERGLKLAYIDTHTRNYQGNAQFGGGGGWHGTSIMLSDNGKGIDFINNWGGNKDYSNLSASQLASWMHEPDVAAGYGGQQYMAGPGGLFQEEGIIGRPDPIYTAEKEKNKDLPSKDEEKEIKRRPDNKKDEEEKERIIYAKHQSEYRQGEQAKAKANELAAKLATLDKDDPNKASLLALLNSFETVRTS